MATAKSNIAVEKIRAIAQRAYIYGYATRLHGATGPRVSTMGKTARSLSTSNTNRRARIERATGRPRQQGCSMSICALTSRSQPC